MLSLEMLGKAQAAGDWMCHGQGGRACGSENWKALVQTVSSLADVRLALGLEGVSFSQTSCLF